jgi:hypothetical protein
MQQLVLFTKTGWLNIKNLKLRLEINFRHGFNSISML